MQDKIKKKKGKENKYKKGQSRHSNSNSMSVKEIFQPIILSSGFNYITRYLLMLCQEPEQNYSRKSKISPSQSPKRAKTKNIKFQGSKQQKVLQSPSIPEIKFNRQIQNQDRKMSKDSPKEFMVLYSVTEKQIHSIKPMSQILNQMYISKRQSLNTLTNQNQKTQNFSMASSSHFLVQKINQIQKIEPIIMSDIWVALGGTHGNYFIFFNQKISSCCYQIGMSIRRRNYPQNENSKENLSNNQQKSCTQQSDRQNTKVKSNKLNQLSPGFTNFEVLQKSQQIVSLAANSMEIHVWGINVLKNLATQEEQVHSEQEDIPSPRSIGTRSMSSDFRSKQNFKVSVTHKYVIELDKSIRSFRLSDELKLLSLSIAGQLQVSIWNLGNMATPQHLFTIDELSHSKVISSEERGAQINHRVYSFVDPSVSPTKKQTKKTIGPFQNLTKESYTTSSPLKMRKKSSQSQNQNQALQFLYDEQQKMQCLKIEALLNQKSQNNQNCRSNIYEQTATQLQREVYYLKHSCPLPKPTSSQSIPYGTRMKKILNLY